MKWYDDNGTWNESALSNSHKLKWLELNNNNVNGNKVNRNINVRS